jgi:hypothetical protein
MGREKGYKMTEEHKRKISEANKGRKHTKEWIENIKKGMYKKIGECAICKDTDKLQTHHIDGDRENNIKQNCPLLCDYCHRAIHDKTKKVEWGFQAGHRINVGRHLSEETRERISLAITNDWQTRRLQ